MDTWTPPTIACEGEGMNVHVLLYYFVSVCFVDIN